MARRTKAEAESTRTAILDAAEVLFFNMACRAQRWKNCRGGQRYPWCHLLAFSE